MDAVVRDSQARVERNLASFDAVEALAQKEEEERAARSATGEAAASVPDSPAALQDKARGMSGEERAARLAAVRELVSPPKQYKLPEGYEPPPSLQAQKEAEEAQEAAQAQTKEGADSTAAAASPAPLSVVGSSAAEEPVVDTDAVAGEAGVSEGDAAGGGGAGGSPPGP